MEYLIHWHILLSFLYSDWCLQSYILFPVCLKFLHYFPFVLSLWGLIKIFRILFSTLLLLLYTLYCLRVNLVIWTLDILDSHLNDKFYHFSDNIITLKHFTPCQSPDTTASDSAWRNGWYQRWWCSLWLIVLSYIRWKMM